VAVFPGGVASAWLYRHSLSPVGRASLRAMTAVTVVGAGLGACLLLRLPGATFDTALPWLLLCATLALAGGPALSRWLVRRRLGVSVPVLLALQFGLGVYAGYFGGAVGIMMMATYSLLEDIDLGRIQAARTMLVTAGNLVAVTIFAVAGAVYWPQALVLGGGAVLGGVAGARFARRLPSSALRTVTVLLCAVITVLFFLRAARA
jgi:uncharacterized membrane protein YfcA